MSHSNSIELLDCEPIPILYEDRPVVAVDKPLVAETALVCFHESAIHGTGGFANVDIVAGTRAIEYVGERITKAESLCRCESNNKYIFSLDETYNLDGNVPWNPARFLNHSCDPNCEAKPDGGCIWIVARRDIRAGEEITFNYGYDLEDYREHPCRCGVADCAGYIVAAEFFEHVRWQSGFARDVGQGA